MKRLLLLMLISLIVLSCVSSYIDPGQYNPPTNPSPVPYYPPSQPVPPSPAVTASCGTVTADVILDEDKNVTGTCFIIGADNIMIDGNGHVLTGDNTGVGVSNPNGYDNIQVKNLVIKRFKTGIEFKKSAGSEIIGNTIETSVIGGNGIRIDASSDVVVSDNEVATSAQGGTGIVLIGSTQDGFSDRGIVSDNTIITKGPYAYGIDIRSSASSKAQGNDISTSGQYGIGIIFLSVNDGEVSDNKVTLSGTDASGIKLMMGSLRNDVHDNDIAINGKRNYGIALEGTGYNQYEPKENIIQSNKVLGQTDSSGILLKFSSGNIVKNNGFNLNGGARSAGILIADSHENTLKENRITSPKDWDLYMSGVGGPFASGEGNSYQQILLDDTIFETERMAYVNINHEDEKKTIFPTVLPDFEGMNAGGYMLISSYSNNPGYASIKYSYEEDNGLNESTLVLYRLDETAKKWVGFSGAMIDADSNMIITGLITFPYNGKDWVHVAAFGQENKASEIVVDQEENENAQDEDLDLNETEAAQNGTDGGNSTGYNITIGIGINGTASENNGTEEDNSTTIEENEEDEDLDLNETGESDDENNGSQDDEEDAKDHACPVEKALVCHDSKNEICISPSALEAHLDHGDNEGICIEEKKEDKVLPVVQKMKKTEIMTEGTVRNIEFTLKDEKKDVKVSIKSGSTPPPDVERSRRKVYSYIEIDHPSFSNQEIADSKMQFMVEREWVDKHGKKQNVVLSKYESSWRDLSTRYLKSDSKYYYYEAQTEGFSVFSINYDSGPVDELLMNSSAGGSMDGKESAWFSNGKNGMAYIIVAGILGLILIYMLIKPKKPKIEARPSGYETVIGYVKGLKNQGMTDEGIKSRLLEAGWKEQDIVNIMKQCSI
ncbi:MAG: PGF-pre-PGF domain-containing protein [Candidatus Woesearchaeota archaeon]|nr:PGF-pre-PGF domain-containing protein [Candidatus Woesearchaeota archaeon]